jgi:hypothetical protein
MVLLPIIGTIRYIPPKAYLQMSSVSAVVTWRCLSSLVDEVHYYLFTLFNPKN